MMGDATASDELAQVPLRQSGVAGSDGHADEPPSRRYSVACAIAQMLLSVDGGTIPRLQSASVHQCGPASRDERYGAVLSESVKSAAGRVSGLRHGHARYVRERARYGWFPVSLSGGGGEWRNPRSPGDIAISAESG